MGHRDQTREQKARISKRTLVEAGGIEPPTESGASQYRKARFLNEIKRSCILREFERMGYRIAAQRGTTPVRIGCDLHTARNA